MTLSSADSTSQLETLSEDIRNEASMQGVLYPDVCEPLYASDTFFYNTRWRGLAELLILIKGQCEGLIGGISDGKFLPRPFCFQTPYV